MLQSLKPAIADCYLQAADCARLAKETGNPKSAKRYLGMEIRWLSLARSMEFSERMSLLVIESNRPRIG